MGFIKKLFYATTTYGMGFEPIEIPNQYSIKIYVGGLAGQENANERFEKEVTEFRHNNNYKSYKIIYRRSNMFPKYYEYIIEITQ
jgi:hypothetical protein